MHHIRLLALVAITGTLLSMHLGITAASAAELQSFSVARQHHGVLTFKLRGLDPKRVRSARVTLRGRRSLRVSVRRVRRAARSGVLRVRMPRSWPRAGKRRARGRGARHRYGHKLRVVTDTTAPHTTITPAGAQATTRAVGSAPLSDADAAARVSRSAWEPRPENHTANHRVPTPTELVAFRSLNTTPALYKDKITGNFSGTTDEIIQWAAHKWGIDEDVVRAEAVQESWWKMSTAGDGGISYGLMQIKSTASLGSFPLSRDSTAFNLDYYGASIRYYYDGAASWLNNSCCFSGTTYVAGDLWGSVGAWFAGRWYSSGAITYINAVKGRLASRTWAQSGF